MYEHVIGTRAAHAPRRHQGTWSHLAIRVADWLLVAMEIRRQRRALATLDDRALTDIGITRAEAETESGRPLWDLPFGR